MSVVKKFFKELEESRVKQVVFFCLTMMVLVIFYSLCMREIGKRLKIAPDSFLWTYQIDEVRAEEKGLFLAGWAFELEQNALGNNYEIVLLDIESDKLHYGDMKYVERKDVNEYFSCEFDYVKSGFEAEFKIKKRTFKEKDYEILLWKIGEKEAQKTGIFLSKGELMYANPKEYKPLNVVGTDLEKIVENGVLRVYRPEHGVYVYQYENELFWITEPGYDFEDGDTFIQYQLYTTQYDKLPEHRLENHWYWDNKGFPFSIGEVKNMDTGIYRVAKSIIPNQYSITKIETGNHIGYWIWHQYFRPYYELR